MRARSEALRGGSTTFGDLHRRTDRLARAQADRDRLATGAQVSGSVEGFVDGAVSGGVGRFGSELPLGRIAAEAGVGAAGSASSAVVAGDGLFWQDVTSGRVEGAIGGTHDSIDAARRGEGRPRCDGRVTVPAGSARRNVEP
ncbi:hypothetical protein [Rhodococcus tukisamuensis]|uniref:hypothetical protein n=1 Tax=Rhodococcus tukisamuensis TaxID=168276 RepID=UPI0011146F83|nr:hypothetical protein [Rhodococcus tukisamuensis]